MNLQEELLIITSFYLNKPDLVQGPGGNTSVKNNEGEMAIKASGFCFDEMTKENGISKLNSKEISDYFFQLVHFDKVQEENKMLQLIQTCILKDKNDKFYPKPSMESGFHAVLEKYVIHTHSVYSNLINCNMQGLIILEELISETGVSCCYIPYTSPGFGLSFQIAQAIKNARNKEIPDPNVFFLENHGIISHSNNKMMAMENLSRVDQFIKKKFNISDYPGTLLERNGDYFIPDTEWLTLKLNEYKVDEKFLSRVLFPDQIVFFSGNICFGESEPVKKIWIDKEFNIRYKCSERESKALNQTLVAYMFIYDELLKIGNQPRYILKDEQTYIRNMDMEKHRKKLMD